MDSKLSGEQRKKLDHRVIGFSKGPESVSSYGAPGFRVSAKPSHYRDTVPDRNADNFSNAEELSRSARNDGQGVPVCLETIGLSSGFRGFQDIVVDDQVFPPTVSRRLYRGERTEATVPRRPYRGDRTEATVPRRTYRGDRTEATVPRRPSFRAELAETRNPGDPQKRMDSKLSGEQRKKLDHRVIGFSKGPESVSSYGAPGFRVSAKPSHYRDTVPDRNADNFSNAEELSRSARNDGQGVPVCLETIGLSSGFRGFQDIVVDDQVFPPTVSRRLYRGERTEATVPRRTYRGERTEATVPRRPYRGDRHSGRSLRRPGIQEIRRSVWIRSFRGGG